jgi:hypothetical protein
MDGFFSLKGTISGISSYIGFGELGGSGTVVSTIGDDGCFSMTMVEDILGLESGSSIIWLTF